MLCPNARTFEHLVRQVCDCGVAGKVYSLEGAIHQLQVAQDPLVASAHFVATSAARQYKRGSVILFVGENGQGPGVAGREDRLRHLAAVA